jgi:rod shape-determining protein MreC
VDSFFARFRNPLTLVAIIIVQVLGLAVQVQRPSSAGGQSHAADGESHKVTLLRHWLLAVVTPVERITYTGDAGIGHLWSNYVDLRHAREQNSALKNEIARLRTEQAQFAEDAREGRRLETLLNFKQHYIASTVAAEVIGSSGSDRSRLLTINKGSADGLRPDQPVITPEGVVGKLRDVSTHTAELQLLSDPNSGAGVVLTGARIRGILRGTATGQVEINNLTPDDRIKPGEQIITSGGDQIFPRGLPIGVIQSVALDPLHQPYTAIIIKPAADLTRLEEVLVVTGTQNALPPAAASDAAQAEATAEALAASNQRAADIIAERLPSLQQSTNADGDNTPATPPKLDATGAPIVAAPKPKPAEHPDRYSPNSTPAADALQPGAPAPGSDSDSRNTDNGKGNH